MADRDHRHPSRYQEDSEHCKSSNAPRYRPDNHKDIPGTFRLNERVSLQPRFGRSRSRSPRRYPSANSGRLSPPPYEDDLFLNYNNKGRQASSEKREKTVNTVKEKLEAQIAALTKGEVAEEIGLLISEGKERAGFGMGGLSLGAEERQDGGDEGMGMKEVVKLETEDDATKGSY